MLKVRSHESINLMSYKSADKIEGGTLTFLMEKAVEHVTGYKSIVETKYMLKGKRLEPKAIQFVSELDGVEYAKNETRFKNEYVSGEPDIIELEYLRDVKCSWSLETFPFFKKEAIDSAKKAGYHSQAQMYMWLTGIYEYFVDYVLLDTPEDLIGYEDVNKHIVEHIPARLRRTSVYYAFDPKFIETYKMRYELCLPVYEQLVHELESKL